jgi:hypothetical protein
MLPVDAFCQKILWYFHHTIAIQRTRPLATFAGGRAGTLPGGGGGGGGGPAIVSEYTSFIPITSHTSKAWHRRRRRRRRRWCRHPGAYAVVLQCLYNSLVPSSLCGARSGALAGTLLVWYRCGIQRKSRRKALNERCRVCVGVLIRVKVPYECALHRCHSQLAQSRSSATRSATLFGRTSAEQFNFTLTQPSVYSSRLAQESPTWSSEGSPSARTASRYCDNQDPPPASSPRHTNGRQPGA